MRRWAAAAVVSLVGCTGCYGSTEPATNVTQDSARLNAHGTANNGPATSYFEYEPANGTGFRRSSAYRAWPAGASGPFSEQVDGLLPATPYHFRLCGFDQGSGSATCAQWRRLTTVKPPGDGVEARFYAQPGPPRAVEISVSARSGPSGEHPSGSISTPDYTGFVTCVRVVGNRAAVVSVGQTSTENDPGPEYLWLTFAGPSEGPSNGGRGDGTGPACDSLSLGDPDRPSPWPYYEIAIWDSP
jgi:hypothetical protein